MLPKLRMSPPPRLVLFGAAIVRAVWSTIMPVANTAILNFLDGPVGG